jgi:HK97 gp10 family phage protein
MPDIAIQIDGMDALNKVLSELKAQVKPQLQKGLMKTGMQIVRQAKKNCPVDTGNLRSSIRAVKSGDDGIIVSAGGNGKGESDVQYAPYVEFGTRNMPAQPYFRPAIDQCMPNLVQNITDALTVEQASALGGVHFKTDLGLGAAGSMGGDIGMNEEGE